MKTIGIEEFGKRFGQVLNRQQEEVPILLTEGAHPRAVIVRLPEGTEESDVDATYCLETPTGMLRVIFEAKSLGPASDETRAGERVFGRCRNMLTIVAEDAEHLKDFEDYMQ